MVWRPGTGRRPTVDEARAHVADPRPVRDFAHAPHVYAQMGYRSTNPNVVNQEQFPELETKPEERLPSWGDMPAQKVRGTGNTTTRADVEQRMLAEHNLTLSQVEANIGAAIDRAHERAGGREMEGARFYPEERNRIGRTARQLRGIPGAEDVPNLTPRGLIGATAVTSPRNPYVDRGEYRNIESATGIARALAAGEHDVEELSAAGKVLGGSAEKAATILTTPGISARDLTVSRTALKVPSFDQNLAEPYRPDGRATIDAHMIQLATGHSAQEAERVLSGTGGYEFFEEGMQRAARRRGLAVEEAQSIAWHQKKHEDEADERYVGAANFSVGGGNQEIEGQQALFDPDEREVLPRTPNPARGAPRRPRTVRSVRESEAQRDYVPPISGRQFSDADYAGRAF